jgi:hypothetical protein
MFRISRKLNNEIVESFKSQILNDENFAFVGEKKEFIDMLFAEALRDLSSALAKVEYKSDEIEDEIEYYKSKESAAGL